MEITDKRASSVEKHLVGYALIILGAAVVTLFWLYISLNNDFRDFLQGGFTKNSLIIQDNSNALRELRIDLKERK